MTSILERLQMTQRQMAIIIVILMLIPVFFTLGLPMPITKYTYDFYNQVEALQPGDVMAFAPNGLSFLNYRSILRAIFYHLAENDAKIIMYCFGPQDPFQARLIFEYANLESAYGYVYGTDYVIFPYLAGEETALAQIASDVGTLGVDIYGTAVEDLPIMQNLRGGPHANLSAISLVWNTGPATWPELVVRQWPAKYPTVKAVDGKTYANIAPWYGQYVFGALIQTIGFAEYEKLTGFGGEDLIRTDVTSLVVTFAILATYVAIIRWAVTGRGERKLMLGTHTRG
jgi:hypothetical protein